MTNRVFLLIIFVIFSLCQVGCSAGKNEKPVDKIETEEVKDAEDEKENTSSKKEVTVVDKKDEMRQYLTEIDPILKNVQITSRSLSLKTLALEAAIKQMQVYSDSIKSIIPPEFMHKQHTMMSLSLRKLRMGFYVLNYGNRDKSVKLVGNGRDLLRLAVTDILEFAKKEGLIKEGGQQK